MIAVESRRRKHRQWTDAMRFASLLGLGELVARSHGWIYCKDEKATGALPPDGVLGTELENRCRGFIKSFAELKNRI